MTGTYITLFVFLAIALVCSFICSVLEAVLLSITPSFVATQKGPFAKQLEKLKRDIDRPLSAILTLNTFAHTIGAAGVGATAQEIWGEEALTVVSVVVTIVILIGSEIIPKTIGAVYWQKLAKPVVTFTGWLTILLLPFVIVCEFITKALRRKDTGSVLSRMDLSQVAALGYRDGLVRAHERDIIANMMNREGHTAFEIMTPLNKLVALEENQPMSALNRGSDAWHVSRIPLFNDNHDNITGYVLKDEALVEQLLQKGSQPLSTLRRPILRIHNDKNLTELYQQLIQAGEHIAIVVDPATDKTQGVVTMEDIIEEFLGQEIIDESDIARGEVN